MKNRPTADDLRLAAEWCESYEDAPDEDTQARMQLVAEWLREQAAGRVKAAFVRKAASEGVPRARALSFFRERWQA